MFFKKKGGGRANFFRDLFAIVLLLCYITPQLFDLFQENSLFYEKRKGGNRVLRPGERIGKNAESRFEFKS